MKCELYLYTKYNYRFISDKILLNPHIKDEK